MFKRKTRIPKEFRTPDINTYNESKNPIIRLLYQILKWKINKDRKS